jgi:hypothetical protein
MNQGQTLFQARFHGLANSFTAVQISDYSVQNHQSGVRIFSPVKLVLAFAKMLENIFQPKSMGFTLRHGCGL